MDKDKKKILAGIGILGALLALFISCRRKAHVAPPPPPEEGKATLWGIVSDASTNKPIDGINITLDGLLLPTGLDGRYEFANIEPSTYSLSFTDPLGRYEPLTV